MVTSLIKRAGAALRPWEPEEGDAALYALSALFALATIVFSGRALYRQWAELAVFPYLAAALGSAGLGWAATEPPAPPGTPTERPAGRGPGPRPAVALFLVVLFGATLIPLSLEVAWRTDGNATAHVQPEVSVVEQAGQRAAHGLDALPRVWCTTAGRCRP